MSRRIPFGTNPPDLPIVATGSPAAVMATSPVSTPSREAWTDPSLAPWQAQRRRARELLAAHQTRLEQAETVVEQQFERIEEELAERIAEVDRLRGERDALAARLALIEPARPKAKRRQRPFHAMTTTTPPMTTTNAAMSWR